MAITVIVLTAIWAFAFQSIYLRDEPRIAASRWIYQNIPGPINLKIQQTNASSYNQPLPFPAGVYVQPEEPYQTSFVAQNDGLLKEILLAHVAAVPDPLSTQLYLSVWQNPDDPQPLASTFTTASSEDGPSSLAQVASFDQSPVLTANQTYYLKLETNIAEGRVNICGPLNILLQAVDQTTEQVIDISAPCTVASDNPYMTTFVPQTTGTLDTIVLEQITNVDLSGTSDTHTLSLFISKEPNSTAGGSRC